MKRHAARGEQLSNGILTACDVLVVNGQGSYAQPVEVDGFEYFKFGTLDVEAEEVDAASSHRQHQRLQREARHLQVSKLTSSRGACRCHNRRHAQGTAGVTTDVTYRHLQV